MVLNFKESFLAIGKYGLQLRWSCTKNEGAPIWGSKKKPRPPYKSVLINHHLSLQIGRFWSLEHPRGEKHFFFSLSFPKWHIPLKDEAKNLPGIYLKI